MRRLLFSIVSAGLGLWFATFLVAQVQVQISNDSGFFGVPITAPWQFFILFGIILGLLNFFVKPILDAITLPLRILTLGLFSFVINGGLIWVVDIIFNELTIPFFWPLFWTSIIIWGLNTTLALLFRKKD